MNAQELLFRGVGITTKKASGTLRFYRTATHPVTHSKKPSRSQAERLKAAIEETKKTLSLLQQRARRWHRRMDK